MNLILIGYRGTGKSTVGKMLAVELELDYVCLDNEIVSLVGKSIPEIVKEFSWEHFRDLEEQVVKKCTSQDGQLLDTGGGVITRASNIQRLRGNGVVCLLTATVEEIVKRIGGDHGRPSLTGTKSFTDEVEEVLAEREDLYQQAAHVVVDTSGVSPKEVVEGVLRKLRELGTGGSAGS
jgi:shikimate kinase